MNDNEMTAMSHENDGGLCWCGPQCGPTPYVATDRENGSER